MELIQTFHRVRVLCERWNIRRQWWRDFEESFRFIKRPLLQRNSRCTNHDHERDVTMIDPISQQRGWKNCGWDAEAGQDWWEQGCNGGLEDAAARQQLLILMHCNSRILHFASTKSLQDPHLDSHSRAMHCSGKVNEWKQASGMGYNSPWCPSFTSRTTLTPISAQW